MHQPMLSVQALLNNTATQFLSTCFSSKFVCPGKLPTLIKICDQNLRYYLVVFIPDSQCSLIDSMFSFQSGVEFTVGFKARHTFS